VPQTNPTTQDTRAPYLRGDELYGDTFTGPELDRWFAEEAEGYADLGAKDIRAYRYSYHALNWFHGFRHLPSRAFGAVLGFGSAYGDELEPIAHRAERIVILEPSDAFVHADLNGVPLTYVKPVASGTLPFPAGTFDLITCSGVLHHIPNVSYVVGELARVVTPDGYLLLREPIHSMGDWRGPRRGLTKNERGIPIRLLRAIIARAGLTIVREAPCTKKTYSGPGIPRRCADGAWG
jgi:SAM-dependent methyltransferase